MGLGIKMGGGNGGINKIPTGIAITTPPNKINYTAGESLDLTGMVVTVNFSDDTSADITAVCEYTPTEGTVVYEDTTQVTAKWTWEEMGIDYTASLPITVQRVLSSIDVTTEPTTVSYDQNAALDLTGMVVTATYTSGATEVVTDRCTSSPEEGTVLTTLGAATVTITYIESGVTVTDTFAITVNVKIVAWATGTDAEIVAMVEAADAGLINLSDYWTVGQERSVSLSAMSKGAVGETHVAQTVTMVLMQAGGKTLTGGGACSFVVGQKNCLQETGYMNEKYTNEGGWNGCERRTWCNATYRSAIPATLRPIFKQFQNRAGLGGGSERGTKNSNDYFALPAEIEVFGSISYSVSGEGSQFRYYNTAANRIKKTGDSGSAIWWWERSPRSGVSASFCFVSSGGSASYGSAYGTSGVAPFGCI